MPQLGSLSTTAKDPATKTRSSQIPIMIYMHIYKEFEGGLCARSLGPVRLSVTGWPEARQAPLSMGFSRLEYWGGLPFPPPRDLPNLRIQPVSFVSPALQVDSLPLAPPGNTAAC